MLGQGQYTTSLRNKKAKKIKDKQMQGDLAVPQVLGIEVIEKNRPTSPLEDEYLEHADKLQQLIAQRNDGSISQEDLLILENKEKKIAAQEYGGVSTALRGSI